MFKSCMKKNNTMDDENGAPSNRSENDESGESSESEQAESAGENNAKEEEGDVACAATSDSDQAESAGENDDHAKEEEEDGACAGGGATDPDDSYEEECVICLEELSSQEWGRCTPCGHAFHNKCWWEWENAHTERVDRQRRAASRPVRDEGPKCCLCNTVNQQFVDGKGTPANNPRPYVASEDSGDNNSSGGGNRFSNWLRDVGEEANGFMQFLQSELRDQLEEAGPFLPRRSPGRRPGGGAASSSASPDRNRRSSPFVPPFFGGSRSASNRSGRGGSRPPFVPPFFGSRSQQTGSSPYANSNGNPFNQIRPGTEIVTQNLVNSPHLNGQSGIVLNYQRESARYLVQLNERSSISSFIATGEGNASTVAIRPENLLQTIKIKIHGLQSQPRLNGQEGTICAYSRQRNRYVVKVEYLLSSAREISIQPTNIRIPNGTCVRLEGLERAPQWNGKYGTIIRCVEDESGVAGSWRYEICLSRQYGVRVKMENVRL